MKIFSTYGQVLASDPEITSYKRLVMSATQQRENLSNANFRHKDLSGIDLSTGNFVNADFTGADLSHVDFTGANLFGAILTRADLAGANLNWTQLSNARLDGVNLRNTMLPSPTMVLLANWAYTKLSSDLVADLMRYDASNHPDPQRFEAWARNEGSCPYMEFQFNQFYINRASLFREKKALWFIGKDCRPYDLMKRLLDSQCPRWTADQYAEFEKNVEK